MAKPQLLIAVLLAASLILSACGLEGTAAARPSTLPRASAADDTPSTYTHTKAASSSAVSFGPIAAQESAQDTGRPITAATCTIPAGWVLYQLRLNETLYSIAARAAINPGDVLHGNCLTSASGITAGTWLYVPPQIAATLPQTVLPLGISAFVTEPQIVEAGGAVNLAWQATGPAVQVRVGWVYGGQFIEEARSLPPTGTLRLTVPADGREAITYMVRVSDGVSEVAAQTTIRVRCGEGWFFTPAPGQCPLPALYTTFHMQQFERGVIVYIPALRQHITLVNGQPARVLGDTFVPGMPLRDPALDAAIPAGLRQPTGPVNHIWRSDKALQAALGYAVGEAYLYSGLMQRAVLPLGEITALSAPDNTVYFLQTGQAWQVLQPQ